MQKLKKTFKINPLYEADGYKVGHPLMIAPNTSREYWTWIARSTKYMPAGIKKIMSAGQQITWRYIHSIFQENFFDQPVEVAHKFIQDMSQYLMMPYDFKGFSELHTLGYLPVEIKALKEGTLTNPNIPHMSGINTEDGYAWLGLFLETLVSKLSWQCPTAATIALEFKKNAVKAVKETDPENLWLADFMCHDFHSRGGNPFTSIAVGLGHAFSHKGGDTLNVIPASRYYYDFNENDVPVYSVNASEHSVTCTGIFYYEKQLREGKLNHEIAWYYSFRDIPGEGSIENPDFLAIAECLNLRDWLKKFPKGILSCVSDTFNLWKLITYILPRLKEEILAREGKLVIRPDSGNPVDILCGESKFGNLNFDQSGRAYPDNPKIGEHWHKTVWKNEDKYYKLIGLPHHAEWEEITPEPKHKGVIELLWDVFGGTVNEQGYKILDSHIGAIYGDSITPEKQVQIYERLAVKGFAATNIVVGVGSYTYVYLTRDSAGYAIKGAWFETKEEHTDWLPSQSPEALEPASWIETNTYNIYKDPITDRDKNGNSTKRSLKGFQFVYEQNGEIEVEGEVSEKKYNSEENLLKTIYKNGQFFNQTTLEEIRETVNQYV
jgi:nicotinamide phosphoribosyltransferase